MTNIPIILFNRDRLSCTERLVDQLFVLGYENIHILDLGSTYKPLLEYYKTCRAEVIYSDNCGHKGFWEAGYINRFENYPWIVISDSDIELNVDTPKGFIGQMIVCAKDFRVDKVGLAIRYHDITNPVYKTIITPIESRYWVYRLRYKLRIYDAPIDTTFCIVRPDLPFQYNAIRIAGEYTCKHTPWYIDFDNMTEEEQYYMDHADERYASCKTHYNKWRTEKV